MSKESFPFEEGVRRRRVRRLFLAQYPNKNKAKPSATDVCTFCGWLVGHYPDLLPSTQGNLYQHLKSDLHDLYDWRT